MKSTEPTSIVIDKKLEELKCFFSSLFYKCCENTAHIMWEEYMKKVLWYSCSWHKESTECKVDETFWKKNFERSWEFVKKNLPYSQLILEFEDFSKHELNLDRESEEYDKLKNLTMNFLRGLYSENNIEQILKLMNDQNKVDVGFGKKIYLQKLASKVSFVFVEPLFHRYDPDFCSDDFYKHLHSMYCFLPEIEGGRTIEKSSTVSHDIHCTNYHFIVLETGERFRSPEQNPRKAFLLYRKFRVPNSCAEEYRMLNNCVF